jgi:hypothetical protein
MRLAVSARVAARQLRGIRWVRSPRFAPELPDTMLKTPEERTACLGRKIEDEIQQKIKEDIENSVAKSPPKRFPEDYAYYVEKPFSMYTPEQLRFFPGAAVCRLNRAPSEIVWNIFSNLLDIDLVVKQRPTTTPAITLVDKPILRICMLLPCFKVFRPIITDKVLSVSGCLYPVIFSDVSNPRADWHINVKPWEGINVDRLVAELIGFDRANIHALSNFVYMVSESVLFKHCDKQYIFPAHDRSYALPRTTFQKDSRPTKTGTLASKTELTPTESKDAQLSVQHVLHHLHNWEGEYYTPRQLAAMNGPDTEVELRELFARLVAIGKGLRIQTSPSRAQLSPKHSTLGSCRRLRTTRRRRSSRSACASWSRETRRLVPLASTSGMAAPPATSLIDDNGKRTALCQWN